MGSFRTEYLLHFGGYDDEYQKISACPGNNHQEKDDLIIQGQRDINADFPEKGQTDHPGNNTQRIDHDHGQSLEKGPSLSASFGFLNDVCFGFFNEPGIFQGQDTQYSSDNRSKNKKSSLHMTGVQKRGNAEKCTQGPGSISDSGSDGNADGLGIGSLDSILKHFDIHRADRNAQKKGDKKAGNIEGYYGRH